MPKPLDLQKIINELTEAVIDKELKTLIGEYVVERIRKRTRLGKGVEEFRASPQTLKKLSANYIKQRKKSKLSSDTTPARSNLTKTGKMLNDLIFRIQGDSIIVEFKTKASARKAGFVSEDRPFLTLSEPEYQGLVKLVRREVLKKLRR